MKFIYDAEVDNADDIILTDDIVADWDPIRCTIRCAERRVSARDDDFLLDDISAGIERYLLQHKTQATTANIESAIRGCLSGDSLLFANDFDVFTLDTSDNKITILISFKVTDPGNEDQLTFKVIINNENQRSYK